MNEPIIVDIGIELCLACPYPDCISSDTELCHLMKDEVARVKAEIKAQNLKAENKILNDIQSAINGNGGLTMPELREKLGYEYEQIETLRRNGKLLFEKKKIGKKTSIVIIGIDKS